MLIRNRITKYFRQDHNVLKSFRRSTRSVDLKLQRNGRVISEDKDKRIAIKKKRVKFSDRKFKRRRKKKKDDKLRRKLINSVKHQFEANSSFLENTTQQIIDWIVSNPVKLTGQLQKVGAKM